MKGLSKLGALLVLLAGLFLSSNVYSQEPVWEPMTNGNLPIVGYHNGRDAGYKAGALMIHHAMSAPDLQNLVNSTVWLVIHNQGEESVILTLSGPDRGTYYPGTTYAHYGANLHENLDDIWLLAKYVTLPILPGESFILEYQIAPFERERYFSTFWIEWDQNWLQATVSVLR